MSTHSTVTIPRSPADVSRFSRTVVSARIKEGLVASTVAPLAATVIQAPLIDEMMREIGVEGSNVARMGDIFRSARDAQSLAKEAESKKGKKDD